MTPRPRGSASGSRCRCSAGRCRALARARFPRVHCREAYRRHPEPVIVLSHSALDTLGALKRSPYGVPERALRSVKDEMRQNLLARLCNGGPLFAGVIGYEETVMPQIVNAILSRHNFILLGLRGQAKSRILRALTTLLDEAMPIVAGGEAKDIQFWPTPKLARNLSTQPGDTRRTPWAGKTNG